MIPSLPSNLFASNEPPEPTRFTGLSLPLPLLAFALSLGVVLAEDQKPIAPLPVAIPIAAVKRAAPVDFESELLPILKANCLACHNQTTAKADLVLETPETIRKGGESGPAIIPARSAESLLLKIAAHQVKPRMPPKENKANARDLTPDELGLLKLWIDQGAKATIRVAAPIPWQPLPAGLNPIFAVALSQDGQRAACARANQIFVYPMPGGQTVTRLTDPQLLNAEPSHKPGIAHRDLVQSLAFSPDGNLLASGAYREVKLWRRPEDSRQFTLAAADRHAVTTLATSPDGKWLATAGGDRTIKLWAAATGKLVKKLSGHKGPIQCLKFSPDSARLAAGAADRTLAVWNVPAGKLFAQTTTPATVQAVTWVFGGHQIATGGADYLVRLWFVDAAKEELTALREMRGHDGPVTSLDALLPAGAQLLSGSGDGTVRQWNLEDASLLRVLKHGGPVMAVAVRPDGKRFASAGLNGVAKLWDPQSGNILAELRGDPRAVALIRRRERDAAFATNEIAFHQTALQNLEKENQAALERVKKATDTYAAAHQAPTEQEKAVATAKQAKTEVEKALAELNVELKKAAAAAEAAGRVPKSDGADSEAMVGAKAAAYERVAKLERKQAKAKEKVTGATKVFDEAEKALMKAHQTRANSETELELAKQGADKAAAKVAAAKPTLQAAKDFSTQTILALQAAQQAAAEAEKPLRTIAFSTDNLSVATAGDDQAVHTWSTEDGTGRETFRGHQAAVFAVAFSAAGLVSGGGDRTAIVWNLNPSWKLERVLGTGQSDSPIADRVNAVSFSPDGQSLATGGGEPTRGGEIKLWRIATGQLQGDFPNVHSDTVCGVAFSPDGKSLASGAADKFAKVLDLATGKVVKTFEGHAHHVLGVGWNRSGRTVITAGADNVVKVWDFVTGERRNNIGGFNKEVTSIAFVGLSDLALTTSGDHRARLLQLDGKEVRAFGGATDFLHCGAVTPDGRIVVAGGQDSTLRVWDGASGQVLATLAAPPAP